MHTVRRPDDQTLDSTNILADRKHAEQEWQERAAVLREQAELLDLAHEIAGPVVEPWYKT